MKAFRMDLLFRCSMLWNYSSFTKDFFVMDFVAYGTFVVRNNLKQFVGQLQCFLDVA
jgi:hypothetical protein